VFYSIIYLIPDSNKGEKTHFSWKIGKIGQNLWNPYGFAKKPEGFQKIWNAI
jgi:hypothetical protein